MNATTTVARRAEQNMKPIEQQAAAEHRQVQTQRRSILASVADRYGMDPDGFARTLRSTVFKGANNEEFAALLVVANEYKLNPLTKEIYAFPAKGGGIVPVVSVDGWIRIMNEHPQFDGIEFNDIVDEKGVLYAIESVIYRRDRSRPIKITEYLDECRRNTDPWKMAPNRMLRHKSLIQGCRVAFGFSGIYSDDDVVVGDITLGGDRDYSPPPLKSLYGIEIQHQEDYDRGTGEVYDDRSQEEIEQDLDRQTFREADGRNDEQAEQVAEEPAQVSQPSPFAARLIGRLVKATTLSDIKSIEDDFLKSRAAMDADPIQRVETEIGAAKTRLVPKDGE